MARSRPPTENVQRVGREALRLLRAEDHVALARVASAAKASLETAKRAVEWLRAEGAPIEYVAAARGWKLEDPSFALPLTEPSVDDLEAALMAAGLLRELGQDVAASRARALFEELAQRISDTKARKFRPDALRVTQTCAVVPDPKWLLLLLRAARRQVVRISYRSPWKNEPTAHVFEPWQVWLHDGTLYVRGFSRTRRGPRTLRLASIESVAVLGSERALAPLPTSLWGDDDPRFGVDEDRPGDAVIRFSGGVARWVSMTRWHPTQRDVWLTPHELLERRMPYRSCRELARRLMSFADAIEFVGPDELRDELATIAEKAVTNIADARPPSASAERGGD